MMRAPDVRNGLSRGCPIAPWVLVDPEARVVIVKDTSTMGDVCHVHAAGR